MGVGFTGGGRGAAGREWMWGAGAGVRVRVTGGRQSTVGGRRSAAEGGDWVAG